LGLQRNFNGIPNFDVVIDHFKKCQGKNFEFPQKSKMNNIIDVIKLSINDKVKDTEVPKKCTF